MKHDIWVLFGYRHLNIKKSLVNTRLFQWS
nr:MAG TPA: hypothetical protein [Caudoviricetes sp.]